jgi:hypothetical protein
MARGGETCRGPFAFANAAGNGHNGQVATTGGRLKRDGTISEAKPGKPSEGG